MEGGCASHPELLVASNRNPFGLIYAEKTYRKDTRDLTEAPENPKNKAQKTDRRREAPLQLLTVSQSPKCHGEDSAATVSEQRPLQFNSPGRTKLHQTPSLEPVRCHHSGIRTLSPPAQPVHFADPKAKALAHPSYAARWDSEHLLCWVLSYWRTPSRSSRTLRVKGTFPGFRSHVTF